MTLSREKLRSQPCQQAAAIAFSPRDEVSGMAHEEREQVKLLGGEAQRTTASRRLSHHEVHLQIRGRESGRVHHGAPTQEDAHTREEFREREGLHDIVISDHVESCHAIADAVPRGERVTTGTRQPRASGGPKRAVASASRPGNRRSRRPDDRRAPTSRDAAAVPSAQGRPRLLGFESPARASATLCSS